MKSLNVQGPLPGWVLLVAALLAAGCGAQSERNRPLPAPIDKPNENYLEVLERVRGQRQTAENLETITEAVEQFQLRMGRAPVRLEELVEFRLLSQVPPPPEGMEYNYDPVSGTIRLTRAGINYLDRKND